MWHRTVWYKVTDVSEQPDAAVFEVEKVDLANYLHFVNFFIVLLLAVLAGFCNTPRCLKSDASNLHLYLSLID
jgi:hypothetical protein